MTETILVSVGHCLEDGHYLTIFPNDIIKNKQYCISEIRSVLENKADYSLVSPWTRASGSITPTTTRNEGRLY